MRAIVAIFLVMVLSGCAVGYARDDRALGLAIGSAEIISCSKPEQGAAPIPLEQQSCQYIKGATISEGGKSLLGKIFDLVWAMLGAGRALIT